MKITIIGAGSSYTPELIEGIINNFNYLKLKTLCLNDVQLGNKKLNIIYDLTLRMFKNKNIKIELIKTLDQDEAIKDANFIITQLRVGGLDTRIIDETIPIKYNMLGQETNGFGGMFKAFRTIPVILDIVNKVEKLAKPNAWIINFSNPAGIVTEAINQKTNFKRFVGVCNCAIHLEMVIAQYLNTERENFEVDWVGLNHLLFGQRVIYNNKNIISEIVSAMVDPKQAEKFTMRNIPPIPYEPTFLKALNLIPVPYYRYFIKYDEMIKEEVLAAKQNNSRAQFVKEVEQKLFIKYDDKSLVEKPKELELRGGAFYSKVAVEVLTALAGGPSATHAVNFANNGNVTNFPKGLVLEISSEITKSHVEQVKSITTIPNPVLGLIWLTKNYELQVIKAAITGEYNDALLAANMSPFTRDDKLNKDILDEMLELHKQYLPNFFKK